VLLVTALDGKGDPSSHLVVNLSPLASADVSGLDAKGITALDGIVTGGGSTQIVLTVAPVSKLDKVHGAYQLLTSLGWTLPVLSLLSVVGAVLLAPRRRQVLLGARHRYGPALGRHPHRLLGGPRHDHEQHPRGCLAAHGGRGGL
jgi:hypothetical protein